MEIQRNQNNLEIKKNKKEKFGELTFYDFNTYKFTINKKLWFGHKDKQMEKKQNRDSNRLRSTQTIDF